MEQKTANVFIALGKREYEISLTVYYKTLQVEQKHEFWGAPCIEFYAEYDIIDIDWFAVSEIKGNGFMKLQDYIINNIDDLFDQIL